MGIVITSTLAQVAVQGHVVSSSGSSRPVWNVFQYRMANAALYFVGTKAIFAAQFQLHVWSVIAAQLQTDYVGDNFWTWYQNIPGDVPTATGPVNNGGQAGSRFPLNQATYCYLGSGVRGRAFNGSKRFAPINTADVTGDELNAGGQAAWANIATAVSSTWNFIHNPNVVLVTPVVWSRNLSALTPPPAPQTVADILTSYVDKPLSSWRHRRERVVR